MKCNRKMSSIVNTNHQWNEKPIVEASWFQHLRREAPLSFLLQLLLSFLTWPFYLPSYNPPPPSSGPPRATIYNQSSSLRRNSPDSAATQDGSRKSPDEKWLRHGHCCSSRDFNLQSHRCCCVLPPARSPPPPLLCTPRHSPKLPSVRAHGSATGNIRGWGDLLLRLNLDHSGRRGRDWSGHPSRADETPSLPRHRTCLPDDQKEEGSSPPTRFNRRSPSNMVSPSSRR